MALATEAMTETEFIERLYLVLQAMRQGDLSPRIRPWDDPQCDKVGRAMNEALAHLSGVIAEVSRVQNEVGHLGQLGPQADVPDAQGEWKVMLGHVNRLAANLTCQVRNFDQVLRAVERGEAGARATVECHGELRQLKDTINRLAAKLEQPRPA
jgi:osomolarity two-component system sensor histidine kinase NIK1